MINLGGLQVIGRSFGSGDIAVGTTLHIESISVM